MSATTGGNTYTLRPIVFDDGLVSIGDYRTQASGPASMAVGIASLAAGDGSVVVGSFSSVDAGSFNSSTFGSSNTTSGNSSTLLGTGLTNDTSNNTVIAGVACSLGAGSDGTVLVGSGTAMTGSSCVVVGSTQTNPGTDAVIMIGGSNGVGLFSGNSVLVGYGDALGANSSSSLVVGAGSIVGDDSPATIIVGLGNSSTGPNSTLLGSTLVNPGVAHVNLIGVGCSVGLLSTSCTILGFTCTIGASSPGSVVQGIGASIGTASPNSFCVAGTIGDNAPDSIAVKGTVGAVGGASAASNICIGQSYIVDGTFSSLLIGGATNLTSYIDAACSGSILIGSNSSIQATSGEALLIGLDSQIINSATSMTVGRGNVLNATGTLAGFVTIVGHSNSLHADLHTATTMSIFGSGNNTTGVENALIVGNTNIVNDGINSVTVGLANTINTGKAPSYCLLLGMNLTVSSQTSVTIGAFSSNAGDRSILLGYQAAIGALSPDCVALGTGATIDPGVVDSQAYGHGAHAQFSNQVVFGALASPVLDLSAVTNIGSGLELFGFSTSLIANNHDTAFALLYKNALGNLISQPVKVDPVTGALTVPL
jgi:hypothetical protein